MPMPNRNKFSSILFANGCSEVPSKSVHFTRKNKYSEWELPLICQQPCEEGFSEVFRNCFNIETKNQEKVYLLFRDEHMIALDFEHYQVQVTNYMDDIDRKLTQCYICSEDYNCDGTSFLLTFQVTDNDVSPDMCRHWYGGTGQ